MEVPPIEPVKDYMNSPTDIKLNNTPKFILLFTVAVGLFILVGLEKIEWNDAQALLLIEVGYIVGNGVAAVRKEPVKPMLASEETRQ